MRRRLAGNKLLLLGCVAAVLLMLFAIGLPHSHGTAPDSHSHNCLACRAQSIQPATDPLAAAEACSLPLIGVVPRAPVLFRFQNNTARLFQSRGPPSFPR